MRGKYFRYLFESLDGELLHTGSIYDKEKQNMTTYIYMVGSYCRNGAQSRSTKLFAQGDGIPEQIDLLVMGGYTVQDIIQLIGIVKHHRIKKVILPYLAPIQRLVLVEELKDKRVAEKEAIRFLQDPYCFLKEYQIGRIYFLYGNGALIDREPEELEHGVHFERVDPKSLQLVQEMEGYAVPVVRAGYIVENGWLFYFGVYGLDIRIVSNFTRDYFSHMENIDELSENIHEDYISHMKRLLSEYLSKFGSSPATTLAMYAGPLYANPEENDIFMTEKESVGEECRSLRVRCRGDDRCMCTVSCIDQKDYDMIRSQTEKDRWVSRFGIFMLGNVNLNRYLSEIAARFFRFRFRIRGVSVPNCGSGEDWNHKILNLTPGNSRIYWICSKNDITSVGVVSDIVLTKSNYRFLAVDETIGCCFSGYIIPKEDID